MSRFTRVTRNWAGASSGQTLRRLRSVAAAVALVATVLPGPVSAPVLARSASCGTDDPATVEVEAGSCNVTINARDYPTGSPLTNFTYIVNVDNTKLPTDPNALSTESNSPIARVGDQDPRDGVAARRALSRLRPGARPQDVGRLLHPAG